MLAYNFLYGGIILILYTLERGKKCGEAISQIVITDVILRLVLFPVIRFAILIPARNSQFYMRIYNSFIIGKFFGYMIWNFVIIVLFALSANDCYQNTTLLYVAILMLMIESCTL